MKSGPVELYEEVYIISHKVSTLSHVTRSNDQSQFF